MWHQCQTDCTLAAAKTRSPLAPLEPNSPRLLTEAKGSGRPALRPQTRPIIPACFTAYYEIEPSPSAISAMCDDELASVPRLTISNASGRISFVDAVDVRGLDFDRAFAIHGRGGTQRQGVTVLDGSSSQFKHKRAVVTLHDVYPIDKKSGKQGTEFL